MGRLAVYALALCAALVTAPYGTAKIPEASARPAAPSASAAIVSVFANLRGSPETSGGEVDGSGRAQISLNVAKRKACWSLRVAGIGKPLSAHVHQAARGEDGPVIIPLGARYSARGCVIAPRRSIRAVASNPGSFYVNVHTHDFLNGAVRGQLHR